MPKPFNSESQASSDEQEEVEKAIIFSVSGPVGQDLEAVHLYGCVCIMTQEEEMPNPVSAPAKGEATSICISCHVNCFCFILEYTCVSSI